MNTLFAASVILAALTLLVLWTLLRWKVEDKIGDGIFAVLAWPFRAARRRREAREIAELDRVQREVSGQ